MTLKLTKKQCPVNELLSYVRGHKCLDCGKCVFGYEGATQILLALEDISAKRGKSTDLEQMRKLAQYMTEQSLCEDGEELGRTALEVLDAHADEFALHIAKKGCTAGVCRAFVTYHILMDKCTGCGDCMDVCQEDAIAGKKKFVHVISQADCIQCGKCLEACEEEAIVKAGADKPRCPPRPVPCKRK
ncbi:MAG: 4Fe-4S binding protein [Oscillibacter sp.]|nr:4Fe-4S binding protein [Oscillibacter sp.]